MRCVIGIDPGSAKVGIAVVTKIDGKIHIEERDVVEFAKFVDRVREMLDTHSAEVLVVGNGTNSKRTLEALREGFPAMAVLVVDERDTTIRARERYWDYTQRGCLTRFVPSSLLVPPVPIDDFSAAILGERVLNVE